MMKPPRSVSLAQHQSMGPYARNHLLYLAPENDRKLAVLLTSTTVHNSILYCKFCDDTFTDLNLDSSIPFLDHLYTHGSNFGANANLEEMIANIQPPEAYFCIACAEAFLTLEALTAHAYLNYHSKFYTIYCNKCKQIHNETTTRAHAIMYHQNDLCNILSIDGILTDELIKQNTFGRKLNLSQRRIGNFGTPLLTKISTLEALVQQLDFQDGPLNFQNWNLTRRQEQNKARARKNLQCFPMDLTDQIARMVPQEISQNLQRILTLIQQTRQLDYHREFIATRWYEVLAFLTSGCIVQEVAGSRYTSQDLHLFELFEVQPISNPRFSPTLVASSTLDITAADLEDFQLVLFGDYLLRLCGTNPTDKFSYLNLSPAEDNLRFPTKIFTNQLGLMKVQGTLKLDGIQSEDLSDSENYFTFLLLALLRIKAPTTVVVELNVYPLLKKFPCRQWTEILSRNLNNYLGAFFALLLQVKNIAFQETNILLNIVVIGQAPFPSLTLSAQELLSLWDLVSEAAADLARVVKVVYLPTTGIVGPGSILTLSDNKPFNQDGTLSMSARSQGLSILNNLSQILRLIKQLGGFE